MGSSAVWVSRFVFTFQMQFSLAVLALKRWQLCNGLFCPASPASSSSAQCSCCLQKAGGWGRSAGFCQGMSQAVMMSLSGFKTCLQSWLSPALLWAHRRSELTKNQNPGIGVCVCRLFHLHDPNCTLLARKNLH